MSHSVTVTRTTTSTSTSAFIVNSGYFKSVPGLLKVFQLVSRIPCRSATVNVLITYPSVEKTNKTIRNDYDFRQFVYKFIRNVHI